MQEIGTYLVLGGRDGFREAKEGQGEVDKAVLVLLNVLLAVDELKEGSTMFKAIFNSAHLVKLQTDQPNSQRGRRRNRRNDFSRNQLCSVLVRRGDTVVQRTQVGCSGDKVDMVVRVVILFKPDRVQSEASHIRRLRQVGEDTVDVFLPAFRLVGDGFVVPDLNLGHSRLEFGDLHRVNDPLEDGRVAVALEAVVEGVQVGRGDEVLVVNGLGGCQHSSTRTTPDLRR